MVGPWQFLRFSLGCSSSYRVKIFSLILDWLKIYLFYCFVFCYPLYTHLEPHLGRLLTWCLGIPPRNVSPSSQCLHSTCGHMESLRTEHILDKLPSRSAQFLNCVHPFVTPWTVAPQTPLSMEFSRQGYYISYSRRSSEPRDPFHISWVACIGRQVPSHSTTWEASISNTYMLCKKMPQNFQTIAQLHSSHVLAK